MKRYLFLCIMPIIFVLFNLSNTEIIKIEEVNSIEVLVVGEVFEETKLILEKGSLLIDILDKVKLTKNADFSFLRQNIILKNNDIITIPAIKKEKLVSINTANREELESIPGIGQAIAQRIIDYRNTHGLFQKLQDIMKIKGIKEKTYNKIKDYITL